MVASSSKTPAGFPINLQRRALISAGTRTQNCRTRGTQRTRTSNPFRLAPASNGAAGHPASTFHIWCKEGEDVCNRLFLD